MQIFNNFLTKQVIVHPTNDNTFALLKILNHLINPISMKKVALVISLFAFLFAITVSTASAQKVTSAEKSKTEQVSKETPAKSCCAKSEAKSAGCAKEGEAKATGCSKTCSKAEAKSCSNKGEAKTEATPVPKSK
jgi:hypothetical protein